MVARRERFHQSRLVDSLSVFDPALRNVTTTIKGLGFSDHAAAANVLQEVINQGFLLSSLDLFYFSGWATLAVRSEHSLTLSLAVDMVFSP
jgi:DHA2 family multidrug resistance protein